LRPQTKTQIKYKMKKTILILASIIITGVAFEGCQKKGANDPGISMHGRKARITGDWAISAGTSTSTSGGSTSTDTWTANSVSSTSGGTTTTGTNAHYTLTIVKDGTWKSDQAATYSVGTSSTTFSTVSSGTWNWTGGVGDLKKKEQFVMRTLSQTDVAGTTTTIKTYTGDDAPATVYEIDELKNKELILIWNGASTSGSSTSTDSGSMTFIQ
jgi:hypothetical protein